MKNLEGREASTTVSRACPVHLLSGIACHTDALVQATPSTSDPSATLRICSLLPSATEIVGRLFLTPHLVCVTHECDVAPDEATLQKVIASGAVRRVTASAINPEVMSQHAIDACVKGSLAEAGGGSLYSIDNRLFAESTPSLVITQRLCDVCAPSTAQVAKACESLVFSGGGVVATGVLRPAVLSLEPESLSDVALSFHSVAAACGVPERGDALAAEFARDMHAISAAVAGPVASGVAKEAVHLSAAGGGPAPSVFVLEWLDPPFNAGHWVPELVDVRPTQKCPRLCISGAGADAVAKAKVCD
jgi:iron complex transport system substrate-binding protein